MTFATTGMIVVPNGSSIFTTGGSLSAATISVTGDGSTNGTGNGAFYASAGSAVFSGNTTLAGATTLGAATLAALTVNGAIGGNNALIKTGTGTVTLGGSTNNTYGGGTTLTGGVLELAKTAGVNAAGRRDSQCRNTALAGKRADSQCGDDHVCGRSD